jgi:hypothetical protein
MDVHAPASGTGSDDRVSIPLTHRALCGCFVCWHGSGLRTTAPLSSKYKFMETQMLQQKKNLMTKVPDIKNALDAIDFLVAKQVPVVPTFVHVPVFVC